MSENKVIKKLTLTDLLKEKEKYQVQENTTEDLFIHRLDASITIRKPDRSLCMDAFQMANDPNQGDKADPYMVYNIVVEPNLKDPQLQKEFGCIEPTDIVEKIFEPGEISKMAGYKKGIDKVKDLKN
jgi:hypothetical protein